MQTHIQKWGNSLGVRIPMQIAKQLHICPGTPVTIEVDNGQIVVRPPQYNLDSMLNAITDDNQHHLLLDDEKIGNEEW